MARKRDGLVHRSSTNEVSLAGMVRFLEEIDGITPVTNLDYIPSPRPLMVTIGFRTGMLHGFDNVVRNKLDLTEISVA